MIVWPDAVPIYLHRDPVDFRKAANGLSIIVLQAMELDPMQPSLFVFVNRHRDRLKVLYWDKTGYALWYKRLEQDKFKWPKRCDEEVLTITSEQWDWLLRGMNMMDIKPHKTLELRHIA